MLTSWEKNVIDFYFLNIFKGYLKNKGYYILKQKIIVWGL